MTGAFVSDKETHRGGYGIVPIGGIIGYNPGFYTSPLNTGFTPSGPNSNSIADMNSWLNEKGWYVCDGAAVNVSVSPVWNQANRYLPNLSNGRFLRGSTTVGGSAGSETASLSHTHTFTSNGSKASWVSATLTTTGGAASFNKTVLNSDQLNHSHGDGSLVANIFNSSPNIYRFRFETGAPAWTATNQLTGSSGAADTTANNTTGVSISGSTGNSTASWSSAVVNTSFTNPSFNKNLLNTDQSDHTHTGTTGDASVVSIPVIPLYLNTVFLIRVF